MKSRGPGLAVNKSPRTPTVAIVLLNWNNTEETLACVGSLSNLTYQNYQIVIVDNGSTLADYEALKAGCRNEVILRMRRNLGFAGGCNAGIRWALKNSFEYVWLLNKDTEVDSESLSRLVETMSDARVGIAGGVMYDWSSPRRIQMAGGRINPETKTGEMLTSGDTTAADTIIRDVDFVSGGVLLARCNAITDVGLLDERFFIYYEDTDWAVRMRNRGWRVVSNLSAKVWHKDQASTGDRKPYLLQHGYFLFLYKNFPQFLRHALRLYARHYLRPHLERRQWRLAWADARVYLRFVWRLAVVRPNLQP